MLRALSPSMFLSFARRWHVPLSANYTNTVLGHHLTLLTMHKTRLDIVAFTPEEKYASARWIVDNGFQLPPHLKIADGKVLGAEYENDSEGA